MADNTILSFKGMLLPNFREGIITHAPYKPCKSPMSSEMPMDCGTMTWHDIGMEYKVLNQKFTNSSQVNIAPIALIV